MYQSGKYVPELTPACTCDMYCHGQREHRTTPFYISSLRLSELLLHSIMPFILARATTNSIVKQRILKILSSGKVSIPTILYTIKNLLSVSETDYQVFRVRYNTIPKLEVGLS